MVNVFDYSLEALRFVEIILGGIRQKDIPKCFSLSSFSPFGVIIYCMENKNVYFNCICYLLVNLEGLKDLVVLAACSPKD